MTQPITKDLYRSAHEAKAVLNQVIEALKKIKTSHIFGDGQAAARINAVGCELQAFLNSWEDFIYRGNQAYANRPEELISKAASRLLNDVPRLINLEKKNLEHKIDAHKVKVEELRKKGLGMQEIDHLCPPVTQEEIDTSTARVAALESEGKALEKFFADAPRYDVELLKNTALAPLTESESA